MRFDDDFEEESNGGMPIIFMALGVSVFFLAVLGIVIALNKENGSKRKDNLEYPKKPYDLSEARELTEEEKQAKADEVIQNLMRMKENFDRAHNKGGDN